MGQLLIKTAIQLNSVIIYVSLAKVNLLGLNLQKPWSIQKSSYSS